MDYFRMIDELEPDVVADEALEAILRHMATLAQGVMDLPWRGELRKLEIYSVVQRLTEYAQQGLPVRDWSRPRQVEEGLLHAFHVLYGSACSRGELHFELLDSIEAEGQYDYLHLVLVAAVARWLLGEWEPITVRGLRVLAAGAWEGDEEFSASAYVEPEAALSWFIEREVPGFCQADLDKLRAAGC